MTEHDKNSIGSSKKYRALTNGNIEVLKIIAITETILRVFNQDPRVQVALFAAGLGSVLLSDVREQRKESLNENLETARNIGKTAYLFIEDLEKGGKWFISALALTIPTELYVAGLKTAGVVVSEALQHPQATEAALGVTAAAFGLRLANKAEVPKRLQSALASSKKRFLAWKNSHRLVSPVILRSPIQKVPSPLSEE